MSVELATYDAARAALAEAARVDDVKRVRDKMVALQTYARQANDAELLDRVTEIRLRAERKAGGLLARMAADGERATRGGDRKSKSQGVILKLADIGVTPTQSSRWQELARVPDGEFEIRLTQRKAEAFKATEGSRAERQTEKKRRRAVNEMRLATKIRALPEIKAGVVYEDPEWLTETWSEAGMDRAPENHYPTSSLEAICARDVKSIMAHDCAHFMWIPIKLIGVLHLVLAARGVEQKSGFVWDKVDIGTGYWVRDDAELLVISTRGNVPAPAMGEQFNCIQHIRKTHHSAKPERFAEIIESYFPNVPKIELNRRGPPRPGWFAWGNEAEEGGDE